jgi:hypothetical protein
MTPQFSSEQSELIADFKRVLPLFVAPGRMAVTLGGSWAKGKADSRSDFDFRVYADEFVTQNWVQSPGWNPYLELKAKWENRGFRIDDFWPRTVTDIEDQLATWESGFIAPTPLVWSVWGYHILTDIASQTIVSDPDGVVGGWKTRLSIYPPALKTAILKQHGEFVRYWKNDYHYESKAVRGDAFFLAGLSAKIVHSLSQILFALNETHFPATVGTRLTSTPSKWRHLTFRPVPLHLCIPKLGQNATKFSAAD